MEFTDSRSSIDACIPIDGNIITVYVGRSKRRFYVHEAIISAKSDFFKAAMRREWKESQERRVELPVESPEMFGFYMQWIYQKKLAVFEQSGDANRDACKLLRKLANAIAMGERLQDISLKDAAVDGIFATARKPNQSQMIWYPNAGHISTIYANTSKNARVRQLLVDLFAWAEFGESVLRKHTYPSDFMDSLARALLARQVSPNAENPLRSGSGCRYHDHTWMNRPCYRDTKF